MFDTHCHLNAKRFKKNIARIVSDANDAKVKQILVPGLDIKSSQKAIDVAETHAGVYASVGIHPEKAFAEFDSIEQYETLLSTLIQNEQVVAIGETGLDAQYTDQATVKDQIANLELHINLAQRFKKPLILHSRGTSTEILKTLQRNWSDSLQNNIVFHCCEPHEELLKFATTNHIYIGVDGDITYNTDKQNFIKNVPLELLLLETDSPYLLPEPLRSRKEYPNVPKNLPIISRKIAELLSISVEQVEKTTTQNAESLFGVSI